MEVEFSIYAVQRADNGRWLIRAPTDDPLLSAVGIVATLDEPEWRPRVRMLGLVSRFDVCEGAEAALLPEWYLD
jgi:hypothetical protein